MIIEYHRPERLEDALNLLGRPSPITRPMGGGTVLNRPSLERFAVVDLQALNLNQFQRSGNFVWVGAAVSLEELRSYPELSPDMSRAVELENPLNLRHQATLAGTIVSADGRSSLTTALLALDALLEIGFLDHGQVQYEFVELGNWLPLRVDFQPGRLITRIKIPLNVRLVYEYVARTPKDLPIVCMALARWPSGRTRLAVGGFGSVPRLALDGPDASGAEEAAQTALEEAEDGWASAEYRQAVIRPLVQRGLSRIASD